MPVFEGLGNDRIADLASRCLVRRFDPAVRIVTEGEPGHSMFVILLGSVEVSRLNEQGERVPFHRLGPGDWFGEMSLLGRMPRTADVTALTSTSLLVIDQDAFVRSVLSSPQVCLRVMARLCRRIRESDDARISRLPVRERLVGALLELGSHPEGAPPGCLVVEMSRAKLAQRIQSRRETVSRTLHGMRTQGLIKVKGKMILIPEPERLSEPLAFGE